MLNNLASKLQMLAHLATILIAILLGIAVTQQYRLAELTRYPEPAAFVPVQVGSKLAVPGIDWSKNERTLLMALSRGCHFCSASAPFYKRLTQELSGLKDISLVAAFPQSVDDARNYLTTLGVSIADVRQLRLDSLGVLGTPTLIMVNREGVVISAWRGQLSPDKEDEVFNQLKCGASQRCT